MVFKHIGLLSLLLYCWNVEAWILDHSCQGHRQLVIGATESAFKMAQNGQNALSIVGRRLQMPFDGNPLPPPNPPQHIFTAILDLFELMFQHAYDMFTHLNDYSETATSWDKLTGVFLDVTRLRENGVYERRPGERLNLGAGQLVIYCDWSSITQGPEGRVISPDFSPAEPIVKWTASEWQINDQCRDIPFTENEISPPRGNEAATMKWDHSPSQLVICRQTLEFFSQSIKHYKHWNDELPNSWITGQLPPKNVHDPVNEDTVMNDLALLDTIILHELTHAIPHLTEDVGAHPYGWDGAHDLGRDGHGTNNADNYAFFALAATLTFGTPPVGPDSDGDLAEITPP